MGLIQKLSAEKRGYLNPENPSTNLANPASWLVDTFASAPSRSGAVVDEKTALYNTALMACVRVLSETVATLPLHIYRQSGERREIDRDHPVARLLANPNPDMDAVQFRETLMAHVLTWGNAYAEIESDGAGRPVRLWILPPDKTTPQRASDGTLYYIASVGAQKFVLPADKVFHLVGLGWDGILGYSPIRMHREAIGLSQAAESFGSSWFGNGSRPSGVLTHPGALSQAAKTNLKASWDAAHSGLSNSQRIAVLEEGLTWTQIGIPPEDAQFLETRKFQVEEIARIFRVPLHLIQHMEKSTSWGTGIEELGQGFITYSLSPWLVRWEQRISSRLISERERATVYARHSVEGLLRGDSAKRAEFYSRMMGIGAYSVNDVLELEDRNPIDNGDARFVPLNWVPLDRAVEPPAEPAAQLERSVFAEPETRALHDPDREDRSLRIRAKQRSAYYPLFREAAQRLNKWELAQLRAAIERARKAGNPEILGDYVGEQSAATSSYALRLFLPVVQAFAKTLQVQTVADFGQDGQAEEGLDTFAEEFAQGMANRWTNETVSTVRGFIATAANEEEAFESVALQIDRWNENRAEITASGETVQSSGAIVKFVLGAIGYQLLRWRANQGACPGCMSMDGKTTRISEPFVSAGDTVDAGEGQNPIVPKRNIGHPPLHGGCSCDIVPA
jgi:HK97 family phage portal protein